jgi:hypothetical protein
LRFRAPLQFLLSLMTCTLSEQARCCPGRSRLCEDRWSDPTDGDSLQPCDTVHESGICLTQCWSDFKALVLVSKNLFWLVPHLRETGCIPQTGRPSGEIGNGKHKSHAKIDHLGKTS